MWDEGVFLGGETTLERAQKHFELFLYKYVIEGNPDGLSCIAGMVDGLTAPVDHKSKTLARRQYNVCNEEAIDRYMDWYQEQLYHASNSMF
jgi:hypothetical protein